MYGKLDDLKRYLRSLESAAVAFSGGVDSAFLLKTAHDVLGDRVLAVTAHSRMFPEREKKEAEEFCRKEGIRHIIFESKVLEMEEIAQNPINRCYLCKRELMWGILAIARENGMKYVVEGSNLDDEGDYRPGMQAVAELGIKSPLRAASLSKAEIRLLSKELGLETWKKPSFACLASRFVYGEKLTEEKLFMVEQAEQKLLELGFGQFRVRIHGKTARIEVLPQEFEKLLAQEVRNSISKAFKAFGFDYVTVDLEGYRTGSMNETLNRG